MIYLSEKLIEKNEYLNAVSNLLEALEKSNTSFRFVHNTKDIWMRDFMPVRTKSGRYVAFRYEPSYLSGTPELCTEYRRDISSQLGISVTYSDINLDGGNVVFSPSRNQAIISDRVFSENPFCDHAVLVRELESLLEARVIIIPSLKTERDIFMPVFGCEMDKKAVNMAKNIFPKSIIPVNIRGIAEDGGGLNCISWEM